MYSSQPTTGCKSVGTMQQSISPQPTASLHLHYMRPHFKTTCFSVSLFRLNKLGLIYEVNLFISRNYDIRFSLSLYRYCILNLQLFNLIGLPQTILSRQVQCIAPPPQLGVGQVKDTSRFLFNHVFLFLTFLFLNCLYVVVYLSLIQYKLFTSSSVTHHITLT